MVQTIQTCPDCKKEFSYEKITFPKTYCPSCAKIRNRQCMKLYMRTYAVTDKYRAVRRRYYHSPEGNRLFRTAQKRYLQSDKGRKMMCRNVTKWLKTPHGREYQILSNERRRIQDKILKQSRIELKAIVDKQKILVEFNHNPYNINYNCSVKQLVQYWLNYYTKGSFQ